VKLLLNEPEAERARELWWDAEAIFTAAVAEVEACAAIARRLSKGPAAVARSELAMRWTEMEVVPVDDALLAAACAVAERHRLRALDAVHLAAAHRVFDPRLVLATWDAELGVAARSAGFATVPA